MVARDIIEQTGMAALIRLYNLIMAIMISLFLALACLCCALDFVVLAALGSFAQVTSVPAVAIAATLAFTLIIHR